MGRHWNWVKARRGEWGAGIKACLWLNFSYWNLSLVYWDTHRYLMFCVCMCAEPPNQSSRVTVATLVDELTEVEKQVCF